MKRLLSLLLTMALLAAGCASTPTPGQTQPAPPDPGPPGSSQPPAPAPQDPPATALLPAPEARYSYVMSDGSTADEYYVRDGNRLIGASRGNTYITWFITGQGIWRADPNGPGLLRYLPPTAKGSMAWKQSSGSAEVWFHLREGTACDQPEGKVVPTCMDLTVLNRSEVTEIQFAPGEGILHLFNEDRYNPAAAYRKSRGPSRPAAAPPLEQMLKQGAKVPAGALPAITDVTPAEFAAAVDAVKRAPKRTSLEIDLNGDGRMERIAGLMGEWHDTPLHLFDSDGHEIQNAFSTNFQGGQLHRVQVVSIPGMDRPTLLYEVGKPGEVNWISLRWLRESLFSAWGWHPKLTEVWAAAVHIQPDGAVVADNIPADMGGYTWSRRFRISSSDDPGMPYKAELQEQTITAGPYPTEPDKLLTAAFVARWYGRDADLERYLPDPAQRSTFKAADLKVPAYVPSPVNIGKLTFRQPPSGDPIPELAPQAPAPDGTADFLATVGQYEGYYYYGGKVTFAKAGDGRLVIQDLTIKQTGFVY